MTNKKNSTTACEKGISATDVGNETIEEVYVTTDELLDYLVGTGLYCEAKLLLNQNEGRMRYFNWFAGQLLDMGAEDDDVNETDIDQFSRTYSGCKWLLYKVTQRRCPCCNAVRKEANAKTQLTNRLRATH